ncbi:MAG TPA: hypothetical protein V6C90_07295 [Coleofasciculaceae cyanobacterium]
MMRFNSVVVASVLLLVLVTGCNQDEQADQNVAPTPVAVRKKPKASPGAAGSPAAGSPKAKPNAAPANSTAANTEYVKQTLGKLNGYLPAAAKALQANDVGKAKDYVKGFSDNWNQKIIQNSVKSQAPESHQKISAGVTQVNNLMKAAKPNQAQAVGAIQSLSDSVSEYAQTP